jgi:hypothetical protein
VICHSFDVGRWQQPNKKLKSTEKNWKEEEEEEEDWYSLDQVPTTSHLINFIMTKICCVKNVSLAKNVFWSISPKKS